MMERPFQRPFHYIPKTYFLVSYEAIDDFKLQLQTEI